MPLILLLGLQVAIVPTVPRDFDLAKYKPSTACESSGPYDVVVCGRRHVDRNRIYPIEGDYETGPLMAQTRIGGVNVGVAGERKDFSQDSAHNGMVSNRIMVGIKIPF